MKICSSCNTRFEVEASHLKALEHSDLSGRLDDVLVCECPACGATLTPAHRGENQTWENLRDEL